MDNLKIEKIKKEELKKLSNEQLLELYKIIKKYKDNLNNKIQKVNEND